MTSRGVPLERQLTAVGAVGLVLPGFWQAVLGVFILPVGGLLVVAVVLDRPDETPTARSEQSS